MLPSTMTAALSAIILAATAFALPNEVVARAKKQGCPVAGGAPTDVVVARAGKAAGGKPVCPVAPVDPAPVPAPDAPVVVARAGGNKPVTAVASAKISVYNSFQCTSNTTPPPATSASDPNVSTFTLSEAQCQIVNMPLGSAITASITAVPKAGTAGCYVQIFTQQGCGVTLQNQYHGFPFDGVIVGSKVGCVAPPNVPYGAIELICG